MKNIFSPSTLAAALAAGLLLAGSAYGQATVTTTTTSDGVITEYGPQTLVIRGEAEAAPVRYSFNETTTYVDDLGNPVSASMVRSGVPVTVHYTRAGDAMVASRVVVKRAGTTSAAMPVETTETTTTTGVINEFGPETIVVRSETSPQPLRYSSSKTTTYVDAAGNPVAVENVRAGTPVTIQYTRHGDALVASRVTLRPTGPVLIPAPTVAPVETRTTTTTVPVTPPPAVETRRTTTTTTSPAPRNDDDDE